MGRPNIKRMCRHCSNIDQPVQIQCLIAGHPLCSHFFPNLQTVYAMTSLCTAQAGQGMHSLNIQTHWLS